MLNKIKIILLKYYWKWQMSFVQKRANKDYPSKTKKIIIFESIPDLSDNTRAVFDEMLKRGINKKFKFVWLVKSNIDQSTIKDLKSKNVYVYNMWGPEATYYLKVAKLIICCNAFLSKHNQNQVSIYLSHGTALKSVKNYYTIPEGIDYIVVASKQVVELQSSELNFNKDRTIPLGFPRNDVFSSPKIRIDDKLATKCSKVVVWYPTFRQHKNGTETNAPNALPIIYNKNFAEKLNVAAKQNDVLIVIKPHFAQDTSYIKSLNLSNIVFIDDNFFAKYKITSYEFVGACDALITDYSSIYYDYTLCNKPIAAIWEDIEEYKQKPGLVENYEYLMQGAEKIYNIDDFCDFINRVSDGIDMLQKEREEIRDYANVSTDGKNSERVVDFIIAKLKEKTK